MTTLTLEDYTVTDSLFDNLLDFFFCGVFVRPKEEFGWSAAQVAHVLVIEFIDDITTLGVGGDGAKRAVHLWVERYTRRLEDI